MRYEINPEQIQALDRVWHKLVVVTQRTSQELWKNSLEGATTIEISILSIVEKKPDVILKEISTILDIPASTLTNAVDRLEKRGLLQRVISKRDRRSFGLELTEQGLFAQMEHRKSEDRLWAGILNSFDTEEERAQFVFLLEKLADNFTASSEEEYSNEK